jgi:hypothetical protein
MESKDFLQDTMATTANWLLKLRCYKCRCVFSVRRIPGDQIASATDASACPECGASADGLKSIGTQRRHLLVEIVPDANHNKS